MALALIMVLTGLGCAATNRLDPDLPVEHESQKRIVRQGFARVPVWEGEWDAIFFGYDRNRDYRARTRRAKGRGIDLLEYKRLRPDGHWEFPAFLILLDVDFDGFVDRVYLDYDRDAAIDAVYAPPSRTIHLDRIDFRHFHPFRDHPPPE
jgi:hypothetical protein